jgi:hypothetical protein
MTLAHGSIVVSAAAKLVDRFGRISRLWYVANPLNKNRHGGRKVADAPDASCRRPRC